jgi:L-lactate dehydrogenase complex protein LldF
MRMLAEIFATPRRFASATRLGRLAQRPFLRGGVIRNAPGPLAPWTRTRDLRPLARESFREWWSKRA